MSILKGQLLLCSSAYAYGACLAFHGHRRVAEQVPEGDVGGGHSFVVPVTRLRDEDVGGYMYPVAALKTAPSKPSSS